MVAKAANAVVSGAVLGLRLQPYEAHIPFLLQFKLDMNLYGMAHMVLRTVEFRKLPSSAMHAGTSPWIFPEPVRADSVIFPVPCKQGAVGFYPVLSVRAFALIFLLCL